MQISQLETEFPTGSGLLFIPDEARSHIFQAQAGQARAGNETSGQGLTIVNAPGTIDSDYRGELKVLLVNLGAETVIIARGDRIAQMVIAPVTRAEFVEADELTSSDRGAGGFGSTGG